MKVKSKEAMEEALQLVAKAAELLGWNIIIPDEDDVTYLMLADKNTAAHILEDLGGEADYSIDIYSKDDDDLIH